MFFYCLYSWQAYPYRSGQPWRRLRRLHLQTCIRTPPDCKPLTCPLGPNPYSKSARIHARKAPDPILLTKVPAPTATPTTRPSARQSQARHPTQGSRALDARRLHWLIWRRHRPRQNTARTMELLPGGRRRRWPACSPSIAAATMQRKPPRERLPVLKIRPPPLLVSRRVEPRSIQGPRRTGGKRMADRRKKDLATRERRRGFEQERRGNSVFSDNAGPISRDCVTRVNTVMHFKPASPLFLFFRSSVVL